MNRLQRYLFGQIVVAVLLAMGLFISVLVVGNVLKRVIGELASGRLDWGTFFQVTGLMIPSMVPYALPIGMLTGVLIVLGRLSAQNEILSMKAAGMSLWRIVSPVFLVALLGVLVSFFINFEYAPIANDSYRNLLRGAVKENPSSLLAPGDFTSFRQGFTIYPEERDGNRLKNVWVWAQGKSGEVSQVVHAESATFAFVEGDGEETPDALEITAHNAVVEKRSSHNPGDMTAPVSVVKMASIPFRIEGILEGLGTREKKLHHHTFFELMQLRQDGWRIKQAPTAEETARGIRSAAAATPEEKFADRIAVQLQIQTNLANALGVLSLTMLAIPLGIKTSRSETLVNIALALALALTFYILTVSVSWIKNPIYRPDILVWIPNFLFQGIGLWLLRKAARN